MKVTFLSFRNRSIITLLVLVFVLGMAGNAFGALSGTYTIDSSQAASATNYRSFLAAVSDMRLGTRSDGGTPNGAGLTGPVVFNVAAGIYPGQLDITGITGLSATNTLTFDGGSGNAATRVITFSGATSIATAYTVRINAVQYVRLFNLSIWAESSGFGWPLHILGTASNTQVKNCIIRFGTSPAVHTSGNYCAVVLNNSSAGATTAGSAAINVEIDSNVITGGYGNYLIGTGANTNIFFRGNLVDSTHYYGLYLQSLARMGISNNTITMNAAGNLNGSGIYVTSCAAGVGFVNEINGNKISNAGTNGIYITSSGGQASTRSRLVNNSVGGGFRSTNAYGIYITGSYNWDLFHNSVNLDAVTTGTQNAALFVGNCCTTGATLLDIRNNIFAVTGNGSSAYPIYFPNGYNYAVASTSALNYNMYYKAGISANEPFLYIGGNLLTMNNFINNSSYNTNSIARNPSFLGVNNLTPLSPCNNASFIASVTTDVNGTLRSTSTPDMGAFEVNGVNNDLSVEAFTAPVLPFTAGNQSITVVLRNYGSNAVTSANVYYSVNGGTPVSLPFTGNIPPCGTSTFTFSGGAQFNFSANTAYTIKAYTDQPNGQNDGNNLNDTTSIPLIFTGLSGVYTIDQSSPASATNFTSFTAAVQALNNGGVSGPVRFDVLGNTPYNEQVTLRFVPGVSATNTITFDGGAGNAANRIITFAATSQTESHTIRINNTSFVTLRNLTIRGTGSTYAWPVHILGNSSSTIKVKNCIVDFTGGNGVSGTSDNFIAIVANNSTSSVYNSASFGSIEIDSNTITGGNTGVFIYGNSSEDMNIRFNTISGANSYGIYTYYFRAFRMNNNTISMRPTGSASSMGIYAYFHINTGAYAKEILSNVVTHAGQYGLYVYYLQGGSGNQRARIANNIIGGSFRNADPVGLYLFSYTTNTDVWFNSVNIDNAATSVQSAACKVQSNCSALDIRNNNFTVSNPNAQSLAFWIDNTSNVSALNYNNYFKPSQLRLISYNGQVYSGGVYKGIGGYNLNAVNINPGYVSATDLHTTLLCNNGEAIAGLNTDVDGHVRNNPPDIGADENNNAVSNDLAMVDILSPATPMLAGLQNVRVLIKNNGNSTITSATINYQVNGGTVQSQNWTGTLNACDSAVVEFNASSGPGASDQRYNFLPGTSYQITAFSALPNSSTDPNAVNDTLILGPVCPSLNGAYTIDSAQVASVTNFVSFTSAVQALACGGISGAVTFNVAAGTYPGQLEFGDIVGLSSTNTITFDGGTGNDSTRIITFAATSNTARHTVLFNNTRYITLRNLTIRGTGTTYAWPVHLLGSNTFITLRNCIMEIQGTGYNGTSTNFIPLVINGSTTSPTTTAAFANIEVDGNKIGGGFSSLYVAGNGTNNGMLLRNNWMMNADNFGMYISNIIAPKINNNTIEMRVNSTTSTGIFLTSVVSNVSAYAEVNRNKIYHAGQYGIQTNGSSATSSRAQMINNSIGGSFRNASPSGLYFASSNNWDIWFNSVLVRNVATGSTTSGAVYFASGTGLDFRNNNLAITDSTSGVNMLPFRSASGVTFTPALNYNNYYRAGTPTTLINVNGTNYTPANYTTVGGANSVSNSSGYTTGNDLIPTLPGNHGISLAAVPRDINDSVRNNPPDMGAFEIPSNYAADLGIVQVISPDSSLSAGLKDVVVLVKNFGAAAITSFNLRHTVNGASLQDTAISGVNLATNDTLRITMSGTKRAVIASAVITTFKVYLHAPNNGAADDNAINDTVVIGPKLTRLSGLYTINPTGSGVNNFVSFRSAALALNNAGVSGRVTFVVSPGTYNEQLNLNAIPGISVTNTVTFDGGNASTTILDTAANTTTNYWTVRLNNSPYVTLRNLTINASGATYGAAVQVSGTSHYSAVKNCTINMVNAGSSTATGFIPVLISSATNISSPSTGSKVDFVEIDSNTINSGYYGIYAYGLTSTPYSTQHKFRGNTLNNIYYYGVYAYYMEGLTISNNTIATRVTGGTNSAMGIYLTSCYNSLAGTYHTVWGNRITQVGQYGIYAINGGGTTRSLFANNMIGGGFRNTNAYGMYLASVQNLDVFHNTINLDIATSGAQYSSLYVNSCTNIDIRNNVFVSTGSGLPLYAPGTPPGGFVLNNNNYFRQGAVSGNDLIYLGATTYTATNFIGGGGYNTTSINTNPAFVGALDLHLTSACGGRGNRLTAVLTDIDGNARGVLTNYGADEVVALNNDAGIDRIYPFTAGLQDVKVVLKNFGANTLTSVNVAYAVNGGIAKVISWSGNLAPCDTTTVVFSGVHQYNFQSGTTYTVEAYTLTPNLQADADISNDTAIIGPSCVYLSGAYTINPTGSAGNNFTSFTAAINALNCGGVSGPVVFNVAPATYNEQLVLNAIPGASAINTITFEGDSAATRIIEFAPTSNTAAFTVKTEGASYVTFRNLTIRTTGTSFGGALQIGSNSNFIKVRRCVLETGGAGAVSASGQFITTLISSATNINNPSISSIGIGNIELDSNVLKSGYYGLYLYGNTSSYSSNIFARNNVFDSAYYCGAYFQFGDRLGFEGNRVNMRITGANNSMGLYMANCYAQGTNIITVNNNAIYHAGQMGIYLYFSYNGSSAYRSKLINNVIGGAFRTNQATPLQMQYAYYWDVWHNTSYLSIPTSGDQYSAAYFTNCQQLDVRNNHFIQAASGSSGLAANFATANQLLALDYNNYINASGNNLLSIAGTPYHNLNYLGGGGYNANSRNINPGFVSATNLAASNACINGVNIPTVTTDINNITRNNPPDIGAYEFTGAISNDIGVSFMVSPMLPFNPGSYPVMARMNNYGANVITAATIKYSINGGAPVSYTFNGSLAPCDTITLTLSTTNVAFNAGTTYQIRVWTEQPNGNNDGNALNDTLTITACPALLAGTYTIDPAGSGAANFTSFTAAANALNCGGISGPVTFVVAPGTYTEQVTLVSVTGASALNTITFDGVNKTSRIVQFTPTNQNAAHTFRISGTPYVTLKNLTIISNGASFGNPVHIHGTSDNAKVVNNNITFGTVAQTATGNGYVGVLVNNEVNIYNITANGSKAVNVEIDSNYVQYGYYGISFIGITSTPYTNGVKIRWNTLDSSYYYGTYLYYASGLQVQANRIRMRSDNVNSQGLSINQCFNNTGFAADVSGNIITQAGRYGAYIFQGSNSTANRGRFVNNMIGGGFSSTNAYGIYMQFSTYWDIWHNSINLDKNTTSAQYAAFYAGAGSTNLDIRNNHFVYSAASGSGLPFYCDQTMTALNYNNYFNAVSNNLLYAGATTYTTTTFVGGGGYNANSVNVNPGFASSTNLRTGGCVKGQTIALVTTDIDGQLRGTPPDIGADESVQNDAGVIAVSLPTEPVSPGLQNIAVLVKNFGGNTISTLTVTYNVNNTGAVTQTFTGLNILPCSTSTITFTGANQYNFPAGRSSIVVYTTQPNAVADNDRANDTLRRNLCGSLSGSYTINATATGVGNFTSFNDAISAMRCAGISGPVVFNVAPGVYNEQVTIPVIQGASATNTITFTGGGNPSTRVLTYASGNNAARHTLKLDSARYVTIDGITIQTTGTNYGWGVHVYSTAKFNTIRRCVIDINGPTAPSSASTNFSGIVVSGSNTNPTTVAEISDLLIDSNTIYNGYYGVVVYGNTATTDSNIVVRKNTVLGAYYYGVYLYSVEGMVINNNTLNLRTSVNQNGMGIYVNTATAYHAGAPFEIDGNKVINAGAYGIYLNGVNALAARQGRLYNNMLGGGFQASSAIGIYLNSSSNWNVYHNSVNLDVATNSINYACVYLSGTTVNTNLKNNHLAYTALGGTGLTLYASNNNNFAAGGLNYNNYYKNGIQPNDNLLYVVGFYSPANYIGGGGYNLNSFNREPGYRGNFDLRTIDGCFNGDSLGVLTDIDGEVRGSYGDIGADEVTDANNDLGVLALLEPTLPLTTGPKDIKAIVKNFGTNTVYKGTLNYSINGGVPVSMVFNDTIQPCDTAIVTFTGANQYTFAAGVNYTIRVFTALPNDSSDINGVNDTLTTPSLCIAMAGAYTINPTGSGAGNFTTFQSAIDALVCAGVSGPVVFNVAAGTYTEQLSIPLISGVSTANTITFDGGAGNAATRILTFGATTNTARQTVRFSGARYVSMRNLTIRNSGATYAWPVHIFNGSRNINLTGNIIEVTGPGATGTSTNYVNVVVSGSLTNATTSLRADSLVIDSNTINGSYASVFSYNQQSVYNVFNGNVLNNPYYYGLYIYNAYELKFRNNEVNMSPTGDIASTGLYLFVLGTTGTTVNEITGNRIRNMGQYGIYLYSSSGNFGNPSLIVNNFIGGGFRNTTQHSGIYSEYSSAWNIWFNSINLDTISGAQLGAIHLLNGSGFDVRNNVLAVTHAASNGIPYYAGASNTAFQLDYNNYYKTGSFSTLIYNGSAYTASNYVGALGYNVNSFSRDPLYTSRTDLHVGNGCNNGVTIAAVSVDIDGHTRTSPPDVGADEVITGFTNNIGVTAILQPTLPLASGTKDVTVVVSNLGNNAITSATVSYSVNGGTPISVVYTDTIQPCDTAIVTFTGSNAFNFLPATSYSLKAFTSLPNGVNDNNLVDDTTSIGPFCAAMSGAYTINPAGSGVTNFTSFTSAVNALQCAGVSDDVTFTVSNGTYNEQLVINAVNGMNDTNTVSFVGQSQAGVILTYAAASNTNAHTVRLNSAPNYQFRNLTIQSTGATYGVPLHILGASNNVRVKNCQIRISGSGLNSANNGYIPVLINGAVDVSNPIGGTGSYINNLEIDSNIITGGYYGVLIYGRSGSPYSGNNMFRNNRIDSSYYYGFYAQYVSGIRFNNNRVNMRINGSTGSIGTYLYLCYNNAGAFHQVNGNRILDAGNYGVYAYFAAGSSTTPNECYNNMVGGGFRTASATGAYFYFSAYWNIYHNSINVDYPTVSNQYAAVSISNSNFCRVLNNILSYSASSGSGIPFYTASTPSVLNYNNYVNAASNVLLNISGNNYTTTNYINGGGYNANGYNTASGFTGNKNLFLSASTVKGDSTLPITTDIEGQLRARQPDVGADEYFGVTDAGIAVIDSPTTSTFCGGNRNVIVRLRNYGNQAITTASIGILINGVPSGTYNWTGNLAAGAQSGQINIGSFAFTGGTYQLAVYTSQPNFGNDTITSNDTAYKVINTTPSVTPTITLSASQTTICSGQEVTIIASYTGGGSSPSIQWRKNGLSLPISGDTLRSTSLVNNDSLVVILTSSATCATPLNVVSNAIKMNVGTTVAPDVILSAGPTTICAGQNVLFTASPVNGGTTPAYRWYKNGVQVGGDSASYLSINPNDNDSVKVVLVSSLGCANPGTDTSSAIVVHVNPVLLPSATITASSQSFCTGTTVTFAASINNGGTTPFYQWKLNGNNIGVNNDTLILNTLTNQDSVQLVLTSNATCATPQVVTSNKVGVQVIPLVQASVSIIPSATSVCAGGQVSFTATPVNAGSLATYSWRVNNVATGTGNTFSSSSLNNGDTVRLWVTTDTLCASQAVVISNPVRITVNPYVTPAVSISASADTVCSGQTVTFTASSVNGGSSPAFQWKLNGANVGTDSNRLALVAANFDSVAVIMTSSASCITQASDTAWYKPIAVNPVPTPSVSIISDKDTVCAGSAVIFTAIPANGGATPAYQWKRNGINTGTNNVLQTFSNLLPGDSISVVMTSSAVCASPQVVTSAAKSITITPNVAPAVSITSSKASICLGDSITYTATAVNGGVAPTFQWKVNGNNAGTNAATFTSTTITANDSVWVELQSSLTCVTQAGAVSNTIKVNANAPVTPQVTVAASAIASCAGVPITFVANWVNGGSAPTLQWKVNGNNVGNNNDSLTLANLNNGDSVWVVLSSNAVCATSASVNSAKTGISITAPVTPSVAITASATSICAGDAVTFAANASNAGPSPAYAWFKNNISVGTNSSTYVANGMATGDVVTCILSTGAGCFTQTGDTATAPAVTVKPLPAKPIVTRPAPDSLSTAFASSAYQWFKDGGILNGSITRSIQITANGVYKVRVDSLGCSNTSADFTVNNVGLTEADAMNFSLYPNPTNGVVYMQATFSAQLPVTLEITDVYGRVVSTHTLGSLVRYEGAVDLGNYADGVYLIKLTQGNQVAVRRVVKAD